MDQDIVDDVSKRGGANFSYTLFTRQPLVVLRHTKKVGVC